MAALELVWDLRCTLGECPTWDEAAGRLWFCDIEEGKLHAWTAASGERQSWQLPDRLCSFCLAEGGQVLVALARRIALFDPGTGALRVVAEPEQPDHVRLNDGKLGPDGAFWVSGMHETRPHEAEASLWRLGPDLRLEKKLDGLRIGNGLAWSADGSRMYLSDSGQAPGWIDCFGFDPATGTMRDRHRFVTPEAGEGLPDGACCDASGTYWSAGNGAGRVNRYAPDGRRLEPVAAPVPTPTMPALGGGALWVTSLRHHQPAERLATWPEMGGLLRMATTAEGLPAGRFVAR